ncbi:MAG: hypothetical protein K9N23_11650 [Akkermansiaceae bacterium]|nr:hypothetical protein [Akkermansiaceae bacterium]
MNQAAGSAARGDDEIHFPAGPGLVVENLGIEPAERCENEVLKVFRLPDFSFSAFQLLPTTPHHTDVRAFRGVDRDRAGRNLRRRGSVAHEPDLGLRPRLALRAGAIFTNDAVRGLAFSPDSRIIATSARDGTAKVWQADTAESAGPVLAYGGSDALRFMGAVAFSPDGQTLACAEFGDVALWDVTQTQVLPPLHENQTLVWSVAFSPDGKIPATGSKSGGIALWDPDTGQMLKDLMGHVGFMQDLAFAPDGKTIIKPVEFCEIRQVDSCFQPDPNLVRNCFRHQHPSVKRRQQPQQAGLVEILEWRRIADHLRHSQLPPAARLWFGGMLELHIP